MRASGRWPWSSFRHYALREKESWKSSQNGQRGIGRGKPQEAGRGYCSSQKPALSEAEGLAPKAGANLGHLRSLLFICREPGNVPPVPSFLVPSFLQKQGSASLRIAPLGGAAVYRCDLSAQRIQRLQPLRCLVQHKAQARQNCSDNPRLLLPALAL